MAERTAKHKLIDGILIAKSGRDLVSAATIWRGEGLSWREIAITITRFTGEDVDPSTLIGWLAAAKAAS